MGTEMILKATNLKKIYERGSENIAAVNGVSLEIQKGEFVSLVGPSGSGKTTLVNILGCLDNPTSGTLNVDGREIFGDGKPLAESALTRIRRELFGYVFQKFYLIPTLTVYENASLPLAFFNKSGKADNVRNILGSLGLENRMRHLPGELSGGEMQRVAIARAIANRPKIILADEPTGNLDSKRADEIKTILHELNRKEGVTVILVTHNPALAESSHRVITLKDGSIVP